MDYRVRVRVKFRDIVRLQVFSSRAKQFILGNKRREERRQLGLRDIQPEPKLTYDSVPF